MIDSVVTGKGGMMMPDREKVIKGLETCTRPGMTICYHDSHECPYEGYGCRFQMEVDALALLKEQEWNVLTEDADGVIHGLPGDDGQYLMTDGKDIWIDEYMDGASDGIFLDSGRDIREITAWMYMPELPKQDRR